MPPLRSPMSTRCRSTAKRSRCALLTDSHPLTCAHAAPLCLLLLALLSSAAPPSSGWTFGVTLVSATWMHTGRMQNDNHPSCSWRTPEGLVAILYSLLAVPFFVATSTMVFKRRHKFPLVGLHPSLLIMGSAVCVVTILLRAVLLACWPDRGVPCGLEFLVLQGTTLPYALIILFRGLRLLFKYEITGHLETVSKQLEAKEQEKKRKRKEEEEKVEEEARRTQAEQLPQQQRPSSILRLESASSPSNEQRKQQQSGDQVNKYSSLSPTGRSLLRLQQSKLNLVVENDPRPSSQQQQHFHSPAVFPQQPNSAAEPPTPLGHAWSGPHSSLSPPAGRARAGSDRGGRPNLASAPLNSEAPATLVRISPMDGNDNVLIAAATDSTALIPGPAAPSSSPRTSSSGGDDTGGGGDDLSLLYAGFSGWFVRYRRLVSPQFLWASALSLHVGEVGLMVLLAYRDPDTALSGDGWTDTEISHLLSSPPCTVMSMKQWIVRALMLTVCPLILLMWYRMHKQEADAFGLFRFMAYSGLLGNAAVVGYSLLLAFAPPWAGPWAVLGQLALFILSDCKPLLETYTSSRERRKAFAAAGAGGAETGAGTAGGKTPNGGGAGGAEGTGANGSIALRLKQFYRLRQVLRHPRASLAFHAFTQTEFSSENIAFWTDARRFIRSAQVLEQSLPDWPRLGDEAHQPVGGMDLLLGGGTPGQSNHQPLLIDNGSSAAADAGGSIGDSEDPGGSIHHNNGGSLLHSVQSNFDDDGGTSSLRPGLRMSLMPRHGALEREAEAGVLEMSQLAGGARTGSAAAAPTPLQLRKSATVRYLVSSASPAAGPVAAATVAPPPPISPPHVSIQVEMASTPSLKHLTRTAPPRSPNLPAAASSSAPQQMAIEDVPGVPQSDEPQKRNRTHTHGTSLGEWSSKPPQTVRGLTATKSPPLSPSAASGTGAGAGVGADDRGGDRRAVFNFGRGSNSLRLEAAATSVLSGEGAPAPLQAADRASPHLLPAPATALSLMRVSTSTLPAAAAAPTSAVTFALPVAAAASPLPYTASRIHHLREAALEAKAGALKIFRQFIVRGSPFEVNVGGDIQTDINAQIGLIEDWQPVPSSSDADFDLPLPPPVCLSALYRPALVCIFDLMQTDSFRRFVVSPLFRTMMADLEAELLAAQQRDHERAEAAANEAVMRTQLAGEQMIILDSLERAQQAGVGKLSITPKQAQQQSSSQGRQQLSVSGKLPLSPPPPSAASSSPLRRFAPAPSSPSPGSGGGARNGAVVAPLNLLAPPSQLAAAASSSTPSGRVASASATSRTATIVSPANATATTTAAGAADLRTVHELDSPSAGAVASAGRSAGSPLVRPASSSRTATPVLDFSPQLYSAQLQPPPLLALGSDLSGPVSPQFASSARARSLSSASLARLAGPRDAPLLLAGSPPRRSAMHSTRAPPPIPTIETVTSAELETK